MDTSNPLQAAIDLVGLTRLAKACEVTHQAVRKWQRLGRMPRTEWTGETAYSVAIEAQAGGQVTRQQLLAPWAAPGVKPVAQAAGSGLSAARTRALLTMPLLPPIAPAQPAPFRERRMSGPRRDTDMSDEGDGEGQGDGEGEGSTAGLDRHGS